MINNPRCSRKELSIIFLGISLLFTLTAKVHGGKVHGKQAGQGRLLKLTTHPFAPVEITEMKVKDTPVSLNKTLNDDKDWINGLTVLVKNISEKPISYISIELRSEPPESGDKPRITSFSSGVLPVSRDGIVQQASTLVSPNASIDVKFTDDQYQLYKDYLQVSCLLVSVGSVFFTDDTLWMKGVSHTRDSKNPNKWNPVKSSVERLEEFYLQKRKQSFMQHPSKSPLPTFRPVAYKLGTKGTFTEDCRMLADAEWFSCDYLCPYCYYTYAPPLEFGHWNYYEVYVNCSGPTYCYPYQTRMEARLDCWS